MCWQKSVHGLHSDSRQLFSSVIPLSVNHLIKKNGLPFPSHADDSNVPLTKIFHILFERVMDSRPPSLEHCTWYSQVLSPLGNVLFSRNGTYTSVVYSSSFNLNPPLPLLLKFTLNLLGGRDSGCALTVLPWRAAFIWFQNCDRKVTEIMNAPPPHPIQRNVFVTRLSSSLGAMMTVGESQGAATSLCNESGPLCSHMSQQKLLQRGVATDFSHASRQRLVASLSKLRRIETPSP